MRKFIFLILLFLLPVGVYLFLKYFTRNEFDIPVFYKERIEMNVACNFSYQFPYHVPDSIATHLNSKKSQTVLIVDAIANAKQLTKIREQFSFDELSVVYLSDVNEAQNAPWKNCFLFLSPPFSAVLIDNENRIRGYYKLPSLDEMDKLDVELKILLKKY